MCLAAADLVATLAHFASPPEPERDHRDHQDNRDGAGGPRRPIRSPGGPLGLQAPSSLPHQVGDDALFGREREREIERGDAEEGRLGRA